MSFITFKNNCDSIKIELEQKLEQKQKAAIKIQSSLRGKVVRKNVALVKENIKLEKAATKIQSSIRGRLNRKNFFLIKEKLRKENFFRKAVHNFIRFVIIYNLIF